MTKYAKCPIEGCDYGENGEKTINQVRGHLGANFDHPNPTDLEEEIPIVREEEPTDDQDDEPESMPTEDEYKDQQDSLEKPDDPAPDRGFSLPAFDKVDLGISDTTLMILVIAGVVILMAWLMYTGDDAEESTTTTTDDQEDDVEEAFINV